MRVGFDCDGVMYDFADSVREFLVTHEGWRYLDCPAPKRWEFYEDWGLTLPEFIKVANAGVDAGVIFRFGSPHDGTRAAIEAIRAAGHSTHLITDRRSGSPGRAAYSTLSWLADYRLAFDTVTFASDKTAVRVDTMVEDKLENYDALDEAGVAAWLIDRPWNQDPAEGESRPRRHRILHLSEYAAAVLQ